MIRKSVDLDAEFHESVVARPNWSADFEGWLEKALRWPDEYDLENYRLSARQSVYLPPRIAQGLTDTFSSAGRVDHGKIRVALACLLETRGLMEEVRRAAKSGTTKDHGTRVTIMPTKGQKNFFARELSGIPLQPLYAGLLIVMHDSGIHEQVAARQRKTLPLSDRSQRLLQVMLGHFGGDIGAIVDGVAAKELSREERYPRESVVQSSVLLTSRTAARLEAQSSFVTRYIQSAAEDLIARGKPLDAIRESAATVEMELRIARDVMGEVQQRARQTGVSAAELVNKILDLAGIPDPSEVDCTTKPELTSTGVFRYQIRTDHKDHIRAAFGRGVQTHGIGRWIERAVSRHLDEATVLLGENVSSVSVPSRSTNTPEPTSTSLRQNKDSALVRC